MGTTKLLSLKQLEERLKRVENQLEKVRGCSPLTLGWQTKRYASASRKWDALAQEKREILQLIEVAKQQNK